MMKKGWWKIALTVVILAVFIAVSISPLKSNLNLGLDLKGGAEVTLQAIPENGQELTQLDMDQLKEVMRKRVDQFGVSEPIIQQEGNDRILIQLAGVDNPEQAIELLGQTAKLEFKDKDGNLILSGAELKDAKGVRQGANGQYVIALDFSKEGAKKFADATTRLVHQPLNIYLDGKLQVSANVNEPILDGKAVITGNYTAESAMETAALLRGGALPVDVEVMSKSTVEAILGEDSLTKSLHAGVIGMILLIIFLIVYYRLPGFVAAISLAAYMILLIWTMELVGVTLTLPGIAGFVLSIGMAVDANIIIYERIKEELNFGKSLNASINSGFKRAMWTILDANITTLIAAIVLFYFGTGAIQGFAVTLSIGIIISMLTALVLTKYLLIWFAQIDCFRKKPALFGRKVVK